jgi:hypothetical protein
LAKDKRDDLLVDPHTVLSRWKNYFHQLMNVHWEGGVREAKMHIAQTLVPEPSTSEVQVATRKLIRCESPGSDQIQAEAETLHSEIH